jgi:hypothetical protein
MSSTLAKLFHRQPLSTTVILLSLATGLVAWKLIGAVALGDPPRLRSDLPPLTAADAGGLSLVIAAAPDSANAVVAAATLRSSGGPPLYILTLRSPAGRDTRRLLRSLGHSAPVLLTVDSERRIVRIHSLALP